MIFNDSRFAPVKKLVVGAFFWNNISWDEERRRAAVS